MIVTSHCIVDTSVYRLPDGRRIMVRHAVPSDAPRLAWLTDADPSGDDLVAIDDHGAIVGWAQWGAGARVAAPWRTSGLRPLLEHRIRGRR
jgi:hypothetical protein